MRDATFFENGVRDSLSEYPYILFNTRPRPPETTWPPTVPMTLPVAPHLQAHHAHRHARWSAGTSIDG